MGGRTAERGCAAVAAERESLIRIWRDSQISDDVLREFEEELDYKESHL